MTRTPGRVGLLASLVFFLLLVPALVAGCTVEGTGSGGRRDLGIVGADGGSQDGGDAGMDASVPVDTNPPHDTNPPRDTNVMLDAVGGGAGLTCTACTSNADCRTGSFCVQLASSGDRVCLQSCDTELPTCPHRFDCLNSVLTPLPGPVCTPVGERCCIDMDEDDYGFGVGCRGPDCDESNPHVYTGATELCNGFDDNCDGTADDGNPGGGNLCATSSPGVCSQGMTMCTAGSITCEPNIAPDAMAESCDGMDNDCDGPIDEGFAFMGDPMFPTVGFPLHNACSVGLGACRRAGAVVCSADHASAVCNAVSATPGTETCNYADDDCNGTVDDPFVDASGVYDADTDCGACGIDCTTIYAHPGSFGTCTVAAGHASCRMNCMLGAFNLNGIPDDGCEFSLDASAIYVSGEDPAARDDTGCGLGPVASGGGNYPCHTITYGQGRAMTTGRTRVLVADALYNESIVLVNGQSLMGGYRADTWERHLSTTLTTIRGTSGSGHRRTITATGITSGLVEGFVLQGANASSAGANSYVVYVSGGTSGLQIRNNVIYAADGAPGSVGGPGTDGLAGVGGTTGADAFDAGSASCSSLRTGPAGGVRSCGGVVVNGGSGGGNACPPVNDGSPHSSLPAGTGNGTGGGAAGLRAFDGNYNATCNQCMLPTGGGSMSGSNGGYGANGTNGAAGTGASVATGSISGSDWVGTSGGTGGTAGHGAGGGGGGAGGGGDGTGSCTDDLGASGGSGGSGGCGGTQGNGGTSGGGSFGIFVVGTTSYPVLTGNTIYRGFGGDGGNGGRGGVGGIGGAGAAGGRASTVFASFCTGDGGTGGGGGNGGHGGGGGGGSGGVSYAIYVAGTTGYGATGNAFPTSGGGGSGGSGGPSLGNSGTAGVSGASGSTN